MAQTGLHAPFKPALLVVDYQEDFCPPSGSLAVTGGRDIATVINGLLQLPFALRVATKDWHPPDHISFADNHDGPDNEPFTSIADVSNPENPSETFQTRLWPVHCVQGSHGAQLIPELDVDRIDHVVEKGQDKRVEMYSAFRNPFRNPPGPSTGLPRLLKDAHISHVYVVGLARDYCVKHTALHAAQEGHVTYVVEEGTKAVDPSKQASEAVDREFHDAGVTVITLTSDELENVRKLDSATP